MMNTEIERLVVKMAVSMAFSMLLFIHDVSATTYYVSNIGCDLSNGLSPSSPWQTIEKVNNSTFYPGDSILFRRGDAWREGEALYALHSGKAGSPIYFGAYGKGAMPLILASKDISSSLFWEKYSGNVWRTVSIINITDIDLTWQGQITPDVANVIFNDEESCGVKKRYLKDLHSQGEFCLNLEDTLLYLYSESNPAIYYTKIEATGIRNCENNIVVRNVGNLVFSDLDVRYSKNNGIFLFNSHDVLIENCSFSWIGGCYYPLDRYMLSPDPSPVRMGNGVQLWKGSMNVVVRDCWFDQVYDAAISPQGEGSSFAIKNLSFHHNLIQNCFYSFEFWGRPATSTGDSIFFENNTCINSGGGWSSSQRPGGSRAAAHLKLYRTNMVLSNIFIRNNIFYEAVGDFIYSTRPEMDYNTDQMWDAFVIDNNCYFQPGNQKMVIKWRGNEYIDVGRKTEGFHNYQKMSGNDVQSLCADPRFKEGYLLKSSSPLIDKGFNNGLKYYGEAPDIGAFEYIPDGLKPGYEDRCN